MEGTEGYQEPPVKKEKTTIPWGLDADKLAPSSLQSISDEKLKSFTVGIQKKSPFQKHKEQVEARKKREEEEAAKVYADFVESFSSSTNKKGPTGMTFLRGETISFDKSATATITAPSADQEKEYKLQPKLWKPPSNTREREEPSKQQKQVMSSDNKKKRSIDELKEELKRGQEARDRYKPKISKIEGVDKELIDDSGSSSSTNLYITNLAPQVTEQYLWKEFGKHGPISSIKIVLPKDEDKKRVTNIAFVCYVERGHAEEAKASLQGRDFYGYKIRIDWGKPVTRTAPPSTTPSTTTSTPPSTSGSALGAPAVTWSVPVGHPPPQIHVIPPSDPSIQSMIHTLASYVAKEGIQFEALVMEKESANPKFQFLYHPGSSENNYYRWKIYSLLQGDSEMNWSTSSFQMVTNGPTWVPPPLLHGKGGDKQRDGSKEEEKMGHRKLSDDLRDEFEDMLRELTNDRQSIKDAMAFSLDHADCAAEIVQIMTEALTLKETAIPVKLARLFLVSDILHNSSARVPNASAYRNLFEGKLPLILSSLGETYRTTGGRITAENLKEQVLKVLRIWDGWSLYPPSFIVSLTSSFTGDAPKLPPASTGTPAIEEEDVDGVPLEL